LRVGRSAASAAPTDRLEIATSKASFFIQKSLLRLERELNVTLVCSKKPERLAPVKEE
jgi:hypothetical protein